MCRLWCKYVRQKINASNYVIALYLPHIQSSTAFHWFKSPSSWNVVIWATRQWKNYVGKLIWYPFSTNIHLNVILLSFWKWMWLCQWRTTLLPPILHHFLSFRFVIISFLFAFSFPSWIGTHSTMILDSTRSNGCLLVKTFYIHFIINSL